MAESLRQALPAQENGVTGAGSHFGPANREYYDPASWAVTTYSTSREIVEHPPPSKRRRIDDKPSFLRGSKDTGFLGPLLTIYHSIPLAREALLMPELRIHAYGHDSTWWSGVSDENTKALSTDNTLRIDRAQCNLLAEVQCLMAFLDRTTRAYGSVDALADLQAVRSHNTDTPFLRFLEAWQSAALAQAPQEQLTQVFSSVAVKSSVSGDSPAEEKELIGVEPPINRTAGETLVDLLDTTIWNDDSGNIDDVWISHAAEIFTIRVFEPASGKAGLELDLNLEPVWYPDRYMYECREATQQMRKQLQFIRREIAQCTSIQRRCEMVKLPDNRILKIREVLDAAAKASSVAVGKKPTSNVLFEGHRPLPEDTVAQSDLEEVGHELHNILRRIEQKLQHLEERKAELRGRMRQIALQLTRPTENGAGGPHRKYTLQGVSTKPEITYFRQPSKDLIDLQDDEGDEAGPDEAGYQWWKTSWLQDEAQLRVPPAPMMGPATLAQAEAAQEPGNLKDGSGAEGSPVFTVDKVSENEVLEAVKKAQNSAILVFTNENAMRFQGGGLGLPLRHFVDRDNQAFAEEMQQEEGPVLNVSGGREAEIEFEDVPLIDPAGSSSSARELTPMSTSSPGRDEDGQPSPKRAKEEEPGQVFEKPPSYEESIGKQEMQEKRGNKIGLYAEQMLQKFGGEGDEAPGEKESSSDTIHSEHSHSSG